MADSKAQTLTIPQLGGNNDPATLAISNRTPLRVAVRNRGPNLIFIAFDALRLQDLGSSSEVYELPIDATETFVLNISQGLYAAAAGLAGRLSVTVSDAIPLTAAPTGY